MKSPTFGIYDTDSIGYGKKYRKVYGQEPKIARVADNEFSEIITRPKNNYYSGYIASNKGLSLDNARDIILMINQLDEDIERYEELGVFKETVKNGKGEYTIETNFNIVAMRCEKIKERLYELL